MPEKKLVAIIIQLSKPQPDKYELISLEQCLKVLNKHPVIFLCPEGLDITFYVHFCKEKIDVKFESLHPKYFKDTKGYNKLTLSTQFYSRFAEFKYILIYQLSSFVFKDELAYWCNKNYDYICAPAIDDKLSDFRSKGIFNKYSNFLNALRSAGIVWHKPRYIENYGFSLRKVSKCKTILTLFSPWTRLSTVHEDVFWLNIGNLFFFYFKLPKVDEALKFAFNQNPEKCYEISKTLPFGCDAFMKHGPVFWKKFIDGI